MERRIGNKRSMRIYREFKREMKEEDYDGGQESVVWFRARTNCMKLGVRRWQEEDKSCRGCGAREEDQGHFILECPRLEGMRREAVELQRPRREREEEDIGLFLFGEENVNRNRRILYRMWRERCRWEDT